MPTIEVVAGPNGSGKTTFAGALFSQGNRRIDFLNPDIIAAGFGSVDFERASFQAGRILIREVKSKIAGRESFAFESTLSGRTWFPILRSACEAGYDLIIYFVYLDNVAKNVRRIHKRVKLGGHMVPEEAVKRRYPRCFVNFWDYYRPICNDWFVFENSGALPKQVLDRQTFGLLNSTEQNRIAKQFLKARLK